MCGLAGWIGPGAEAAWLESAVRCLQHRGPDDSGTWLGPENGSPVVGLAHTRLAILDLSVAGHQPFSSADGQFHLVYNGEVYNYLELRAELRRAGEVFRTETDTEVVLSALRAWGPGALSRFTGMFALALIDTAARTVLFARDMFGMKPLYLATSGQATVFASEPTPLLGAPGVSRRADPVAVYDFLRFGLVDHGTATMFADVRRFPAGCYAVVPFDRPHAVEPRTYVQEQPTHEAASTAERIDRLRELLLESTRLHLRSDVAIGAALSGGIDSSCIVGAMRAVGAPDLELHTFTFSAQDPAIDELGWAKLAGQASGAISHVVRASGADLCADLDTLIVNQAEPFPTSSIYAQAQVFRAAKAMGVTVLLDGQGGDELFAGYRPFLWSAVAEDLRAGRIGQARAQVRVAAALTGTGSSASMWARSLVAAMPRSLTASLARGRRGPTWINETWFRGRSPMPAIRPGQGRATLRAAMDEAMHFSVLPSLLRYEDRNSMAYSRESRLPFLTPAMSSFARSVPRVELLGPDGSGKWLLREAMRGLVPDRILDRKDKIGFETPERAWLTASEPWVRAQLRRDVPKVPALRLQPTLSAVDALSSGNGRPAGDVWRALCLSRWSELFEVSWT